MTILLVANQLTAPPTDAGPISIIVDRSTLQVAPDSVRFKVDLSASTFDTPAPASGEIYDPRMHDLVYIWDTGDTGQWDAPENVLPQWNDKSQARGPAFAHCYTTAGTKTVSLLVVEPSTGKTAQATVNVVIQDPDTVYAGTKTVCINPQGDDDFTGAPSGSQAVNMDGVNDLVTSQTWWAALQDGLDRRYLFKGGATYPATGFDYTDNLQGPNPLFATYGTGKVNITPPVDPLNDGQVFSIGPDYLGNGGAVVSDFRISGLDAAGIYDPKTLVPSAAGNQTKAFLRTDKYVDLVIHNCTLSGFRASTIGLYMGGGDGEQTARKGFAHLDDVAVLDLGGQYGGVFAGKHDTMPDSWLTLSGVRLTQDPEALASGTQQKAPMRENGFHTVSMRCVDVYGHADSNAGLKLCTTPTSFTSPHIVNVDGLSIEGGAFLIQLGQNLGQGVNVTIPVNAVIDGVIGVADYSTVYFVDSQTTGVTLRNMLGIVPDAPRLHNSEVVGFDMNAEESTTPSVTYASRRMLAAVRFYLEGTPSAATLAAPCRVYSCTFNSERPNTKNGNVGNATVIFPPTLTNALDVSNIKAGETWPDNADPGELTDTELFTPRNIGFKGYQSGPVLLTQNGHVNGIVAEFATPDDAVKESAQVVTTAATGRVAHYDIRRTVRTTQTIGAA